MGTVISEYNNAPVMGVPSGHPIGGRVPFHHVTVLDCSYKRVGRSDPSCAQEAALGTAPFIGGPKLNPIPPTADRGPSLSKGIG